MKGLERERNLAKEVYHSDVYFSYAQLWSFVEQIYHIKEFTPTNVLEIGVGSGFVSTFLKTSGINVKTFDLNPNLSPDIVASVSDIRSIIRQGDFDLISCCEVLEHMPFDEFETTIKAFSSLSDRLFLTLPIHGTYIGFGGNVQLPKFRRWIGAWLKLPFRQSHLPDMHFWEVDYLPVTRTQSIVTLLRKYYSVVDTKQFKANPYHRYFKCSGAVHSHS